MRAEKSGSAAELEAGRELVVDPPAGAGADAAGTPPRTHIAFLFLYLHAWCVVVLGDCCVTSRDGLWSERRVGRLWMIVRRVVFSKRALPACAKFDVT